MKANRFAWWAAVPLAMILVVGSACSQQASNETDQTPAVESAPPEIDDLVLGFTSVWRKDSDVDVTSFSPLEVLANERESKSGTVGFFLSGERRIIEGLRIRGGVWATAQVFERENVSRIESDGTFREMESSEHREGSTRRSFFWVPDIGGRTFEPTFD